MDFGHIVAEFNWPAIIVATLAAFGLGGAWYSRCVFGVAWMQDVGLAEQDVSATKMRKTFAVAFVLQFAAAMTLATLLGQDGTWLTGVQKGLIVGTGLVATAYGVTYLFEQRPLRLFMINAGYNIVLFAIMGAIIGGWHSSG